MVIYISPNYSSLPMMDTVEYQHRTNGGSGMMKSTLNSVFSLATNQIVFQLLCNK